MRISHCSNLSCCSFLVYIFLLLFHLLLLVSSSSGNSNVNNESVIRCLEKERKVLVDFKEGLIDPEGWLSSWVGLNCCKWQGVICNNTTGHVTELDLFGNSLVGSIPASIGNLSSLTLLDLSHNNLNGTIPESLWELAELSTLKLASNKLEGSLILGALKNLQECSLYNNSFWGSIPASIGNLTSLRLLDLSNNNLNGTIPQSFGKLSQLSSLHLSTNQLEGVLTEAHFANLTKLDSFALTTYPNRSLIFDVKHDWVPPFRLTTLELDNCKVGPAFPFWLRVQTNLTSVVITNAGISDTIGKEWLSTLFSTCNIIDLSNNQIKGKLPAEINSGDLDIVNLSRNRFEGQIPVWNTSALTQLYLHRNNFSGSIPDNIGELMPNLETLFLSRNQISGTLPSSICQMTELMFLSVGHNRFAGQLPNCWGSLRSLRVMDVSNNSLSGEIPSSLTSICGLVLLIMSNNNLRGNIPPPYDNDCIQSSLYVLQLRSNLLEGSLPEHLCHFSNIRDLDLSDNNFMGSIPRCFHNFTALKYGNESFSYEKLLVLWESEGNEQTIWVGTKGSELEFSRTLLLVKNIDLSKNNLTGEIPGGIFSLAFLDSLNLSRNHLSGSIPRSIGDLRKLESLDLSHNNFSGTIPPSLSSLTFLGHLKLSNNNLSGRIPTGNQLQTLNDSSNYEGNPLLCGVPLETRCPGDNNTPPTPTVPPPPRGGNDGGDSIDKLWLYLITAMGFIVGFWSVCGTLILKESWRHAYYGYVDDLKERLLLRIDLMAARSPRMFGRGNN